MGRRRRLGGGAARRCAIGERIVRSSLTPRRRILGERFCAGVDRRIDSRHELALESFLCSRSRTAAPTHTPTRRPHARACASPSRRCVTAHRHPRSCPPSPRWAGRRGADGQGGGYGQRGNRGVGSVLRTAARTLARQSRQTALFAAKLRTRARRRVADARGPRVDDGFSGILAPARDAAAPRTVLATSRSAKSPRCGAPLMGESPQRQFLRSDRSHIDHLRVVGVCKRRPRARSHVTMSR